MAPPQHQLFCAVFGDVIGSRKIVGRDSLQRQILLCLDAVNSRFAAELASPFRFVAGDEVRGLLSDQSPSYQVIRALQDGLRPYRMRFAAGIGELTTDLGRDVAALDGPAFHRAAEAMLFLKSPKRSHERTVYYLSEARERDRVVNSLAFLVDSIRATWTDRERERADLLSSGLTLLEVGQRLGVSHQAIRQSMMKASYRAVLDGETLIDSLLAEGNV